MEVTSHEGVHLLAIFPPTFTPSEREHFIGWLEIAGTGDTRQGSKKIVSDIFEEVDRKGGVIVVPHPFTDDMGLLAAAPKIQTRAAWLQSGHVRLMQIADQHLDKIRYIDRGDDGTWVNRYVLASAPPQVVSSTTYCLAPFNSSDAHAPGEMPAGCSWFRMEEPSIDGLKQVACEPRTRISRDKPSTREHSCILAMRVVGGYCDGQVFHFNDGLTCIVGQNYAGKSAVFDFLRFALAHEDAVPEDSRSTLLLRLHGILQPGGRVELYLRHAGAYYVIKRPFEPDTQGEGLDLEVLRCPDPPTVYRLDENTNELNPVADFQFPIEVYEQGRIHHLRDDLSRQLDMLDGFANVTALKNQRSATIAELRQSAENLSALYEERDQLQAALADLPGLEKQLKENESLLPGDQDQKWATSTALADDLVAVETNLADVAASLAAPPQDFSLVESATELERLFCQQAPALDPDQLVDPELLRRWVAAVTAALQAIDVARAAVLQAIAGLQGSSRPLREQWTQALDAYQMDLRDRLATAGVESPRELVDQVADLRRRIRLLRSTTQPRLVEITGQIDRAEEARSGLLRRLEQFDASITSKREEKARELTAKLDPQVKISVAPRANRSAYRRTVDELCRHVTNQERRIQNRESQIALLVSTIDPLQLAAALASQGSITRPDGSATTLCEFCGITPNTQDILCRIADNITLLNKLQTVAVPDVPKILVRRRGESEYAELRAGLSPGEQSAALLTLALATRGIPLVIDQPEDELGYNYIVDLTVPKLLQAKATRQILVITHNANIPVLGDADFVIKMTNRPRESSRECVVEHAGTFETRPITDALLELEGGPQAFRFRQHRYSIPKTSTSP